MTRQIFYILFIAANLNCYAQEINNDRNISAGIYGIAFPAKYHNKIYAGGLLDISLIKTKRLYSSSSINYTVFYHLPYQFHSFSIASGLSWKLQKNHFCFRPSIQLGYLYQYREYEYPDFLFQGVFVRVSSELTYIMKRFEYGFQLNCGIGYGPTTYYSYSEPLVQNKFGSMVGVGLQLKYTLFKK